MNKIADAVAPVVILAKQEPEAILLLRRLVDATERIADELAFKNKEWTKYDF